MQNNLSTVLNRFCCSVVLAVVITSCGGSSDGVTDVETVAQIDASDVITADEVLEVAIDPQQTDLLDKASPQTLGGDAPVTEEQIVQNVGSLLPAIFESETGVDPAYAQSGAALVQQLNESLVLPADIDVNFIDCGQANAFFVPAGVVGPGGAAVSDNPAIFMCHELTELFGAFYGDLDQAFSASVFVLMHEIGHALVDQLSLPVLGIEESYVDGVAAVLLGESGMSEGSVLAGWFFGSQPDTPFTDSHRANPQRLGDLACWGVGADPSLLEKPIVNSIVQQLVLGGRNCPAEYTQQVEGLTDVLDSNIIGGLSGALSPQ